MSELTVSPKGFNESLHFLRFTLNTNVSLELSQGFIQLHAWKIHLIHDATVKGKTKREQTTKQSDTGFRCSTPQVRARHDVCVCLFVSVNLWVHKCWRQILLLQSYVYYRTTDLEDVHTDNMLAHMHTHYMRTWGEQSLTNWERRGMKITEKIGREDKIMSWEWEDKSWREVRKRLSSGCSNAGRTYTW